MAQMAVARPGGKLNIGNIDRLDPVGALGLGAGPSDEGLGLPPMAVKLGDDLAPQTVAEPCAHVAGIDQLAAIVVADQKRA
jgi:hypothetical protein